MKKITSVIVPVQCALFTLGIAYEDRAFEKHDVPALAPEFHSKEPAAIDIDDGENDPLIPPPPVHFRLEAETGYYGYKLMPVDMVVGGTADALC